MAGQTYIATWIYAEPPGEESTYPAVSGVGKSSTTAFQAVYWRCVAVFFATSVRQNPEARQVLFTNVERLPEVDGLDMGAFLDRVGVDVVHLGLTYVPPPGYYQAWRNQFYIFDVIRYLDGHCAPDDVLFVLDSDCVWAGSAGPMVQATRRHGALTYDIGLPPGQAENGLTREDMGAIYHALLGTAPTRLPEYFGGEVFAATGAALRRIAAEVDPLWNQMMEQFQRGEPRFNEEAHALSFLYYKLGFPAATANPFIKRIWTALLYRRTAETEDQDLILWHLPAEKRYGIRRLFDEVKWAASPFWLLHPGEPLKRYLGAYLGMPRRSLGKFVQDVQDAVRFKGSIPNMAEAFTRAVRQKMKA